MWLPLVEGFNTRFAAAVHITAYRPPSSCTRSIRRRVRQAYFESMRRWPCDFCGTGSIRSRAAGRESSEYVSLRYVEASFGRDERDAMLAKKRDAAAKAHAILGHGAQSDDELFAKGPLLLFELEDRIGRAKLDRNAAGAEAACAFEARLRE